MGKTKKRVIAIASGDWHIHDWAQFNEEGQRLQVAAHFIDHITKEAEIHGCNILFTGDLGQTPKGWTTKTMEFAAKLFRTISKLYSHKIIGIAGNHDFSETNTLSKQSPSMYRAICHCFPSLFIDVGFTDWVLPEHNLRIYGIPYVTHNQGIEDYINLISVDAKSTSQRSILLLHSDIWGARDTNGREVGGVEGIPRNLGKFFKNFDLVLCGHIHQQAELWENKVYMVGAPFHQRKTDMGSKMGYYYIYEDLSVKFQPYKAPMFKEYHEGTDHPDTHDYWVKIPKAVKRKESETATFTANMGRSKMAKKYAKQKGIKSKTKIQALTDILNKVDNE